LESALRLSVRGLNHETSCWSRCCSNRTQNSLYIQIGAQVLNRITHAAAVDSLQLFGLCWWAALHNGLIRK